MLITLCKVFSFTLFSLGELNNLTIVAKVCIMYLIGEIYEMVEERDFSAVE